MGFFRQESWSGLPFPPLGDLPNPGTEPSFPVSSALTGGFFSTEPLGKQRTLETREKMQGQNVVWPWRDEGDGGKLGPRVTWVALDYARRGDMALRSSASLIWCPRDPCSLLSQSFMTTSESSRVLYTVKCYAKWREENCWRCSSLIKENDMSQWGSLEHRNKESAVTEAYGGDTDFPLRSQGLLFPSSPAPHAHALYTVQFLRRAGTIFHIPWNNH